MGQSFSLRFCLRLVILVGIHFAIALFVPEAAFAESDKCYFVSGAGLEEINGYYLDIGEHNGRPAFQHENFEYFISYNALGYGEEWNLTTDLEGGLDLYFVQSNAPDVPGGQWLHGFRGLFPGVTVRPSECSGVVAITSVVEMKLGELAEGSNGRMGAFTSESFASGMMVLTKLPFGETPPGGAFEPRSKAIQVDVFDEDGNPYATYGGVNYIYFNLTRQTRELWWQRRLQIYHFDGTQWHLADDYYVWARWPGRIATLVSAPGIYVLGSPK